MPFPDAEKKRLVDGTGLTTVSLRVALGIGTPGSATELSGHGYSRGVVAAANITSNAVGVVTIASGQPIYTPTDDSAQDSTLMRVFRTAGRHPAGDGLGCPQRHRSAGEWPSSEYGNHHHHTVGFLRWLLATSGLRGPPRTASTSPRTAGRRGATPSPVRQVRSPSVASPSTPATATSGLRGPPRTASTSPRTAGRRGATPSPAPSGQTAIRGIAFDSRNGDIWLVGSSPDRIYKSTDGGATWSNPITGPSGQTAISGIAFDSRNGDIWLVGSSPDRIYKSTDGGATWSNPITGPSGQTAISGIAFDSRNGDIWLVGDTPDSIYKSTDGGATWSNPITGPSGQTSISGITFDSGPLFINVSTGFQGGLDGTLAPAVQLGDASTSTTTTIVVGDSRNVSASEDAAISLRFLVDAPRRLINPGLVDGGAAAYFGNLQLYFGRSLPMGLRVASDEVSDGFGQPGPNLTEAWENSARALVLSAGGHVVEIPGPLHSTNETSDTGDEPYDWLPSAAKVMEIQAWVTTFMGLSLAEREATTLTFDDGLGPDVEALEVDAAFSRGPGTERWPRDIALGQAPALDVGRRLSRGPGRDLGTQRRPGTGPR